MRSKIRTASTIVIVSALAFVGFRTFAMQQAHEDNDALLKALPKAKFTLTQGIQQSAKAPGVPISAKFEMDHSGQLALSVYVADKGLAQDAEHNVLKELIGSPESAAWTSETEVFKDVAHVARSAEQLTLIRLSSKSLLDIVKAAEKAGGAGGTRVLHQAPGGESQRLVRSAGEQGRQGCRVRLRLGRQAAGRRQS
ncbi:MAG: hypothetical protein L0219_02825 [Phycisphaerales bacterium]|nr:hypothetical protein [Phycisphaerales bacterium]